MKPAMKILLFLASLHSGSISKCWKHGSIFRKQNKKPGKPLRGQQEKTFSIPKNLVHASDVIYKFRKEIAAKAKYRLINANTGEPLKVVDHIGCHYAKIFPSHGIGGAEYPYVLAGLIDEWGGQQVDYPERRHCCGFGFRQYLLKSNRGYSVSNSKKKFDSMLAF